MDAEQDSLITFPGETRLDIPTDRVLKGAEEAELSDVVIIGYTAEGDFYFASSFAAGPEVLWLMKIAERRLIDIAERDDQ